MIETKGGADKFGDFPEGKEEGPPTTFTRERKNSEWNYSGVN